MSFFSREFQPPRAIILLACGMRTGTRRACLGLRNKQNRDNLLKYCHGQDSTTSRGRNGTILEAEGRQEPPRIW